MANATTAATQERPAQSTGDSSYPGMPEIVFSDLKGRSPIIWQCQKCGYELRLNNAWEAPTRCPLCGFDYIS